MIDCAIKSGSVPAARCFMS